MFERYREDARRAIFFARWEAQQAGSPHIEPKHILLGLIRETDAKTNQLFTLSAYEETFRTQLGMSASAQSSKAVNLPLSNPSKRVLAYTAEEAERLSSKPIGTEHLLLGLLREKKSDVPEALAAVGIDLHSARNRIRQECNLPLLERKLEGGANSRKTLRPFAAFVLLILVLLLIYVIFRLVFR